jgi:hypothetical protein
MAEDTFLAKLQAGLLGRPNNPGGMLGDDDLKSARQQALMTMGAQLLSAGGPSSQPIGLGQALGGAMMAGQQAQSAHTDGTLKSLLLKSQIEKAQQKAKPSYMNVGAGGTVIDPVTGKVIFQNQAKANEGPANVQEWEYYSKLPPDAKKEYLEMKRNQNALQLVDVAGGKQIFNKASGALQGVTTAEQEAAAASTIAGATASGRVAGETQATATADLPRVLDNAEQALATIEDFEKHPGFGQVFGAESYVPTVRGTSKAGALAYYKQIKGKTFLEAFNSLKGGGQITEVEGQKAEDAIARLDQAQSDEDAIKALEDLKTVIKDGVARARKKASGGASTGVEDPLGIRK